MHTGRATERDRAMRFLPWLALGVVWLLGIGAIVTAGVPALTMMLGRRIGGGATLTVCDVPNVCVWTGGSEQSAEPLAIEAVSRGSQIFSAFPGLLMIVVVLAVLHLGTRVVWRVSHGQVFEHRTVRGLGWAAGVLLVGGAVAYVLEEHAFTRAMDDISASGLLQDYAGMYAGVKPVLPAVAFVFGLLVLAAWAAFRHGARMAAELRDAREELDGVV